MTSKQVERLLADMKATESTKVVEGGCPHPPSTSLESTTVSCIYRKSPIFMPLDFSNPVLLEVSPDISRWR